MFINTSGILLVFKVYFIFVYLSLSQVAVCYPMHRSNHNHHHITRSTTNFYLQKTLEINALSPRKKSTEHPVKPSQHKPTDIRDDFSYFWTAWRASQSTTDMSLTTTITKPLNYKRTSAIFYFPQTPLRQAQDDTVMIGNEVFEKLYVTGITYPNPTDENVFLGSYYNSKWVGNFWYHIKHFGSTWSTILEDHYPNPAVTEGIGKRTWIVYFSYQPNVTKGAKFHRHFYVLKNLTTVIGNGLGTPIVAKTDSSSNKEDTESSQSGDDTSGAETTTLASGATVSLVVSPSPATAATEHSWLQKYAPYLTALVAATAILCGICCAYRAYKRRRLQMGNIPLQWRRVGTLKKIYAYPVKSCGPVTMTNAECTFLGVRDNWMRDRFLMVVDTRNKHVSARSFPDLLSVQPTMDMAVLTLQYKNMEPLHINLSEVNEKGNAHKANVCDVSVPVKDCGPRAREWFSRLLDPQGGRKYRLVLYASENGRQVTAAKQKIYGFTKRDTGALSNEAPFNLINEASVNDLNSRLTGCRVSPRNFRPNFVVSGAEPFEEDKWKFLKIRDTVFTITKPCYRCVMTTIDPDTTVRNPNYEPLETLRSYRQSEGPEARQLVGAGPRLGLQLSLRVAPRAGATLAVNDPVIAAYDPSRDCQTRRYDQKQLNAGKAETEGTSRLVSTNRSQEESRATKTQTDVVSKSKESVKYERVKICDETGTTHVGGSAKGEQTGSDVAGGGGGAAGRCCRAGRGVAGK